MLVYGDAQASVDRAEVLRGLAEAEARVAAAAPGTLRHHAALVARLLTVGELSQVLLDRAEVGGDDGNGDGDGEQSTSDAVHALLLASARPVVASFLGTRADPLDADLFEALRENLPDRVALKVPEGYAHYGVYVESYIAAARTLRLRYPNPLVVGLRSIGTSLGAVVAATLGGALTTLRPKGPPFARTVRVSPSLEARLQLGPARSVVLVDEGPGISGSSLGGAADWFEARGVRDLAFLPSHGGALGGVASPHHRARWEHAHRPVVGFDAIFERSDSRFPLARWFEDLIGPAERLEPLPGGAWRARLLPPEAAGARWPPAHPQQERPKYILHAGRQSYLVKFVGLGRASAGKLERGRRLAAAGFAPEVKALRHGFLLARWYPEGRPLHRGEPWGRPWIETLASYLSMRSRMTPPQPGASALALFEMMLVNTREALGAAAERSLCALEFDLAGVMARAQPVDGDKKLQPWEWLLLPSGRLLKCDALDHLQGHDLLGPQDLAWDLAGALSELDFDARREQLFFAALAHHGVPLPLPADLHFYRVAYLAFAIGHATFAFAACSEGAERTRWGAERARYTKLLDSLIR